MSHLTQNGKSEYFGEFSFFVIELPVSEQGIPKVIKERKKIIQILQDHETFEEVQDKGPKTIGGRGVIS